MSEMIDRVARALCTAMDKTKPPWPPACREPCSTCTRDAREAIAAMRDPTEKMMSAFYNSEFQTPAGAWVYAARPGWQAMIDAALKE